MLVLDPDGGADLATALSQHPKEAALGSSSVTCAVMIAADFLAIIPDATVHLVCGSGLGAAEDTLPQQAVCN